ncbi:hypothetical protein WJX79_011128 [Trebouxia sp. C0005]
MLLFSDTTPPVITILGANPYTVTQGQAYSDPGATAYDAVDGVITSIVTTGVSAIDTMVAGSYSVTYTAEDAAGNVATATRVVKVVSPCTGVEHFCSATCRCSTLTVCLAATSICASTTTTVSTDTTPPVITVLLNSMSVNATTSAGLLLVVTTVYAATQGLREVVVACKSPTVKCTASDGTLFCSTSTGLCVESTTTTAATTGTYPTIKLIGQAVLGETQGTSYLACPTPQPTNVICDRGCSAADSLDGVLTPYVQACSTSTAEYLFTTTGINACSYNMTLAGVYTIAFTVTNSQGLSASVNRTLVVEPVCPSGESLCSNKIECSSSGLCPGTTALVLTTVTAPVITLVTSTYLSSVVEVKQGYSYEACSTGQSPTSAVLCELGATAISASDGNLTSVVLACPPTACLGTACPGYRFVDQGISSCAVNTSATVGTTFAVTFMVFDYSIPSLNATVSRTISIIDPCDTGQYLCSDGTCSDVLCSTRDALSTGLPGLEFIAYGNSTSVTTGYGVAAAIPLVPCTTADSLTDCGAVALDSTGSDISSSIVVVDVQQQYAVTLTLPLTLSAANLTDAQTQADVLTATSNATDALESALAAGLISEFASAPNLTAAAAAQNLTWAPISVSAVTVDGYNLAMNTSDSASLTLSLRANLGVSGDISDVAPDAGTSRRRHLLQTTSGLSINSSLVSASLSSALSLNVTAVSNSSTNDTDGAQLTNYTLTTATVDDDTAALSGLLANLTCIQAELYEMESAFLLLQHTETQLSTIYSTFAKAIAAILDTGDSTEAASSSTSSTTGTTLTTASGCARDTDGGLRVQFYVSADNITREIDGLLLSGGRRLQSTPCSATDGTTLALNYTTTTVTVAANSTTNYTNGNASDPVYASQQLSRLIGWNGNQVVAGVLLQTTRRLVTHSCNQRFDKFTTECTEQQVVYDTDTGQAVVVPKSSGGSAPYGVDAVFLADSSAYDDTAVVGDFYNTSASSGEITPYVGTPYGFHPRAMSGFSLGFPVVFDNRLSYNASQRLFAILSDGNYLDDDTAAVTVRLLTFNAELQVYGYARVDFTWGLAGLMGVVARFVAIPDITLKSSSNSIDQTEALSETWVLYDMAVLASMLVCLITYSIYIQSLVDFQPQDTYEVYDSLGGAQARLLLPKKKNPSTYNVSAPSTWAEGITMQLLILRFIRVLSAQKRLSILTTTAVKVMPWILDVGYTVMCVALMLAAMGHILFGDFEVTMVTLPDSISGFFEVMFTQQVASYDQDLGVTTTGPMQMNWLLRSEAYAWYFLPPIASVLILWWFLRGIIVSSFREEAKAQSSVVGMHNDLAVLFKEFTQNLAGAPSNALLVGLFREAAPRRLRTNVWARLRGQKEQLTIQERQRQGILGIHMDSLDEHLDQQQLQQLLGKVIQGTSACLDGPTPDHQVLAAVVLSRFGGVLHNWPEGYFKAQQSKGNALAGIFKQAMNQHQAQKISRTRSIISRMFYGGSALARLKSLTAPAIEVDKPSSSAGRTKLGSFLQHTLSPSQQPAYAPVDADSSPEADMEADDSSAQLMPGSRRTALPRDASLGQKLGSLLKGALSLPRQTSYVPVGEDAESDPSDSSEDSLGSKDPSLHESDGLLSLSGLSGHSLNNARDVLPRELSLRERFGSMSLSRVASMTLPAEQSLMGSNGANDLPVPMSPARRRALPRDASYLPEWVNCTLGRGSHLHGDGQSSPRSRLGTTSSNASADSDPGDGNSIPKWVDWPASPRLSPQHSAQASQVQPEDEGQGDLSPVAPLLLAPPHLRRQQQQPPKADAALPRAKRPLALATDPLSLS